jgi:hypothetical protein
VDSQDEEIKTFLAVNRIQYKYAYIYIYIYTHIYIYPDMQKIRIIEFQVLLVTESNCVNIFRQRHI